MQTVEVKQAAAWKFLWWAGTFPVNLIVQENRKHLTVRYIFTRIINFVLYSPLQIVFFLPLLSRAVKI